MLSESLPAGTITLGAPETQPGFIVTSPKVHQSILIRDINHQAAPIKREAYFVQNTVDQNRLEAPTEITLGTAVTTATNNNITQSDNVSNKLTFWPFSEFMIISSAKYGF